MREIHTFWPLITYLSPWRTALVLILVVSVPAVGSVTPIDCRRRSPAASAGRYLRFCSSLPFRSRVNMLYSCPCTVPELPPQRLTSSRITEASARPRPEPPYSAGTIADSQPALAMASTKASGKPFSSSILRQ
ncbi:hypothetical protein FQZ97_674190 [compost metagenome]